MGRHVALLRGINVGGKNVIRMADLRACFEDEGFEHVTTYIQSGNVIFDAPGRGGALERRIEQALTRAFDYAANVVLRSLTEMGAVVGGAPDGFGADPEAYRYDVLFLKRPLTARAALREVPAEEGVDRVHPGPDVLYYRRVIDRTAASGLDRLASRPVYARMTVRKWNTTLALLRLLEG